MSQQAFYTQAFNVRSADKQTMTDGVMAGIGVYPEKAEGANYEYDSIQQAYTKAATPRTFALGLSYTKEAQEDELYGLIPKAGSELGRALAYTKEVHAWGRFHNNLSATLYTAGGTAYPLLSATHYRVDGGTWSNTLSTSAALSIEALELGLSEWYDGMLDQRGLMQVIEPKFLIHGPSDRYLAHRLLKSIQQPQGNDNDPNAVRAIHNLVPLCVPYLTNDGRWFLQAAPSDTGLTFWNRVGMMTDRFDTPENGNVNMVARARFLADGVHPSGVFGSAGS